MTATTGTMSGLLGYQSAWTDTANGKNLMGARWYDSGVGDFTSADTVQVSPVPDSAAGKELRNIADALSSRKRGLAGMSLGLDPAGR